MNSPAFALVCPSKARSPQKTTSGSLRPKKPTQGILEPWSLAKADSVFSKRIIARDKKCQYPDCKRTAGLTCSHYYGRVTKSTRFDDDNAVALCRPHHYWDKQVGFEFQKQTVEKHRYDGRYTIHMRDRLGTAGFAALAARSQMRVSQRNAILSFMARHEEPC